MILFTTKYVLLLGSGFYGTHNKNNTYTIWKLLILISKTVF